MRFRNIHWGAIIAILAIAGCAPSQKTVTQKAQPSVTPSAPSMPQPVPTPPESPLEISVAYPVPDQWRPAVDSNFIFGTVGNGHATLTINGYSVPVWKNGAFLAFLPMPANGQYHLEAHRGTDVDSRTVSYRSKSVVGGESSLSSEHSEEASHASKLTLPQWAAVIKGSDTLQTGNDVAPGAREPDGNREWFFPKGCRVHLVEEQGKYYKIELDKNNFAWVADSNFDVENGTRISNVDDRPMQGDVTPSSDYIDLHLPCHDNPFQILADGTSIRIHIYGASAPETFRTLSTDPLLNNLGYDTVDGGMEYTALLSKPVWGYKVFYQSNGSLDVRIRRPPRIDPSNPLKGIRIMLDPGHPPGGAIGPTGLTEREANMAEATRLRDRLSAAGAIVLMTHNDLHGLVSDENQVQELDARTALAVRDNVDLYISMHNNAFPDGTNPFLNYGTSTFYYWPFSAALAADLDHEIAQITGIPNLGSMEKSLAVCRPTWMPCALTESLFMMFPDQEAELRDPAFWDKLAEAHLHGIEDFLRERAQ